MNTEGFPVHGLCFLDATELAPRIRGREISAAEVVEAHLQRIDALMSDWRAPTRSLDTPTNCWAGSTSRQEP